MSHRSRRKHEDKSAFAKSAGKCRRAAVLHLITIITWLLSPSYIFSRTGIITGKFPHCSFHMTVVSNYTIAIATLSDWLKNISPIFQPMRSRSKTNRTWYARFFRRFDQITGSCYAFWLVHRAVCSCCDWLGSLLWYCFSDSYMKTALPQQGKF